MSVKIYLGAGSLLDIRLDWETALPTPVACNPLNDVMGTQNIHLRNTVKETGEGAVLMSADYLPLEVIPRS